jgi:hypothetical protein
MPRLTNHDFLVLHHALRQLWLDKRLVFGDLTSRQQWELHQYFVPARDMSHAKLLAHRRQVTKEHPSLPQRAGRVIGLLLRGSATPPVRTTDGDRTISVRAVVKPAPDFRRLQGAIHSHLLAHPELIPRDDPKDDASGHRAA